MHIISIYVSLGVMNKMKVISCGGSSHGLNVENHRLNSFQVSQKRSHDNGSLGPVGVSASCSSDDC